MNTRRVATSLVALLVIASTSPSWAEPLWPSVEHDPSNQRTSSALLTSSLFATRSLELDRAIAPGPRELTRSLALHLDDNTTPELLFIAPPFVTARDLKGRVLWTRETLAAEHFLGPAVDLDDDLLPEVLIGDADGRVAILSAVTGHLLWRSPAELGHVVVAQIAPVPRARGRSLPVLVLSTRDPLSGEGRVQIFDFTQAQRDGSGALDPSTVETLVTLDGASLQAAGSGFSAMDAPIFATLVDFDGALDRSPELLVERAGELYLFALEALGPRLLASAQLLTSNDDPSLHIGDRSAVVVDADGDGGRELILLSSGAGAHFLARIDATRTPGGSPEWQVEVRWRFDFSQDIANNANRELVWPHDPVVDLDGDGDLEILVSGFNHLDAGDWRTLVFDANQPAPPSPTTTLSDLAVLGAAQLDADAPLELVLVESSGPLTLTTPSRVHIGSLDDPQLSVFESLVPSLLPVSQGIHRWSARGLGPLALVDPEADGISGVIVGSDSQQDGVLDTLAVLDLPTSSVTPGLSYLPLFGALNDQFIADTRTGSLKLLDATLTTGRSFDVPGWLPEPELTLLADLNPLDASVQLFVATPGELIAYDFEANIITRRWSVPITGRGLDFLASDVMGDEKLELVVFTDAAPPLSGRSLVVLDEAGALSASLTLSEASEGVGRIRAIASERGKIDVAGTFTRSAASENERVLFVWDPESPASLAWRQDGNASASDGTFEHLDTEGDFAVGELDPSTAGEEIAWIRGRDASDTTAAVQLELYHGASGALWKQHALALSETPSHVQLVDADGDGDTELLLSRGALLARVALDGTLLYIAQTPGARAAAVTASQSAGAARRIVVGDSAGTLHMFDGNAVLTATSCSDDTDCSASEHCVEALCSPRAVLEVELSSEALGEMVVLPHASGDSRVVVPGEDRRARVVDVATGTTTQTLISDARRLSAHPADLDGDGDAELVLASSAASLSILDAVTVEAPQAVRDVEVAASGTIIDSSTDIDAQVWGDRFGVSWEAVSSADGYVVELFESDGFRLSTVQISGSNTTRVVLSGLFLRPGFPYVASVQARVASGRSARVFSDGLTVGDLEAPRIVGFEVSPASFNPERESALIVADLSDDSMLASAELRFLRDFATTSADSTRVLLRAPTATLEQQWSGRDEEGKFLPDGVYTLELYVRDLSGSLTVETRQIALDTLAPSPPLVNRPGVDSVIGELEPSFGGTAVGAEGGRVEVVLSSDETSLCMADVDVLTAQWSCTTTMPFDEGSVSVRARAWDAAGNGSELSTKVAFRIDTSVPETPVILQPAANSIIHEAVFDVIGSTGPDTTVEVYSEREQGDLLLCEAVPNDAGEFRCQVGLLLDGKYTIYAVSKGPAGLRSGASIEVAFFVNLDGDADNDGMFDRWELLYGLDPYDESDGLLDLDDDGASNLEEFFAGSSPADADSDDDGLCDGDEVGWNIDVDGDGAAAAIDVDSDNDGVLDGVEAGLVQPCSEDTDTSRGFFVPDADPSTQTAMDLADTDGDGFSDGAEDPNHNGAIDAGEEDPTSSTTDVTSRLFTDSDQDGLTDRQELLSGSAQRDADTDDDGIIDGFEANWRVDGDGDGLTNVLDPDSDQDGLFDGTERGVQQPSPATDLRRGRFWPDRDPETRTSMILWDTDGDTLRDGLEDPSYDGRIDDGELDPLDARSNVNARVLRDSDGDGLSDREEILLATKLTTVSGVVRVLDADSDDDGVLDGDEPNWWDDHDADGRAQLLDPDSDNDCVQDGTEMGVTEPHRDTNPSQFVPDADGESHTWMLVEDTDGDGLTEDREDLNCNGRLDRELGETDPLDPRDPLPGCLTDADCDNAICLEGVCQVPSTTEGMETVEAEERGSEDCECRSVIGRRSQGLGFPGVALWVLCGLLLSQGARRRR